MKRKLKKGKAALAGILACSLLPVSNAAAYSGIQAEQTLAEKVTETYESKISQESNKNHMLNAMITTSSNETTDLNGDKVRDGKFGRADRWASDYEVPTTNIWLKAQFQELTKIKQIDIHLFERDIAPMPSNIEKFSIKYTDETGEEHYLKKDFVNEKDGEGYSNEITILLDETVYARDLTICEFTANAAQYNNISIAELEVYSEEHEKDQDLDSVAEGIEGETIEKEVTSLPMPDLPEGFSAQLNGADFEQIVAKTGEIIHPLTDKTVQISYIITDETTGETKETADIPYVIKGLYQQEENKNVKPYIIPEIAEWYSDSTETLDTNTITTVVYDDPALESIVDEFILDYKDFTGIQLKKEQGSSTARAYNFSMKKPDPLLGEEGYTMDIEHDRIDAASESVTGNMFAMQTILQMYKYNGETFQIGQMRDYPRFQTRGFIFDIARKPVSMEMVQDVARTMRYYKMNDLHLHLSDNYIFLEQYGKGEKEDEAFQAYEAFRLESGLTNEKGESPTAEDYAISKENFRNFIKDQRDHGMKVVPEIDVPAHSMSFTKIWPELKVSNQVSPTSTNRPLIDHLDISKTETRDKIKEIFDDYTKGENPTFDSETTVHIGADEFVADYTAYREFTNDLIPYIKETNPVRMWGGFTWIDDNKTEINEDAIENVEMNLWSKDWSDGIQMYDMGFKLINTIDDYGYMVPSGSLTRANSYGDLLNVQRIFDSFEPNKVRASSGYEMIPSGDEQMLGAAFAIWGDNIDKSASGLSESDLYWRFFDAMPFYAEKTWATTGKEKGTSTALSELASNQGTGPRTNPYYEEENVDGVYESYDFENDLEDGSKNDRDLTIPEDSSAKIEEDILDLAEGNSYAETPIEKLGNDNQLSFDIKLDTIPTPGEILFESDSAYGTHDIRIMEDGKLGFTRELYQYYFDYELPVGKTVNIKIVTEQQKTSLYVDGEFVADAKGKYIHNDIVKKEGITNATFALPLQRIGSKTNAVDAKIDNVIVSTKQLSVDEYNKNGWTGTTNTETVYDDKEGLLEYAFDNNKSTRWHSNWTSATDKLDGTNEFWAELDFGKAYKINQFSFTPRLDAESGQVTKADLYIKSAEQDEWRLVAQDQVFSADKSKKTFYFEEQNVRYVKFVAKQSNDGWVAVSEFDIADKELDTYTIYVEAEEGGTVSGNREAMLGETVTVTATAKSGYRFAGWFNSAGEKVSDQKEYTFEVNGNCALTAHFDQECQTAVLEYALELADQANTTGVVESVVNKFEETKTNARAILDAVNAGDASVTQEMVDNAWKELIQIMQYLSFKQGEKADLERVIAAAETIDLKNYLDEGQEIFTNALQAAKEVYENRDAMQEEVDQSWQELLRAMSDLRLKPDKTILQELLQKAEGMSLEGMEEEAVSTFRAAVAEAKIVLSNEQATKEEVEMAAADLKNSMDRLSASAADTTAEEKEEEEKAQETTTDSSTSKTSGNIQSQKSVKTGDGNDISVFWMLTALGIVMMSCAGIKKRKER